MKKSSKFLSLLSLVLVISLSSQLISCGYVFRPERRDQKVKANMKIDWAIAGLDAIGILFFIIPGLVAFGVDFYSGTIYLPEGYSKGSAEADWSKYKVIKVGVKNLTPEAINAVLAEYVNTTIDFKSPNLQVYKDQRSEKKLTAYKN